MTRDGTSRVLADRIDGQPIGKVNFVVRDSRDRLWVTMSTRIKNWMHALRTDLKNGYIVRVRSGQFRIVVDGFGLPTRSGSTRTKNTCMW
jgi:gluconolactonase